MRHKYKPFYMWERERGEREIWRNYNEVVTIMGYTHINNTYEMVVFFSFCISV